MSLFGKFTLNKNKGKRPVIDEEGIGDLHTKLTELTPEYVSNIVKAQEEREELQIYLEEQIRAVLNDGNAEAYSGTCSHIEWTDSLCETDV